MIPTVISALVPAFLMFSGAVLLVTAQSQGNVRSWRGISGIILLALATLALIV